jgi:hypothetical protein
MANKKSLQKVHKWRSCPEGEYWRSDHVQPTYIRKSGVVVHEHPVKAGCCENPSKKDQIYSAELELIAKKYFATLKGPPTANSLGFGKRGNSFDDYIRGWTQFWNDVLGGKAPLDANLVKALIATESGFGPNKDTKDSPKNGYARGRMQVTDSTLRILADDKGELRNHLVHIDQEDIHDPNFNIASGVRWLFHKRDLAASKLGRDASWDEAVAEYKNLLRKMRKNPDIIPKPMQDLHDYYKRLNK